MWFIPICSNLLREYVKRERERAFIQNIVAFYNVLLNLCVGCWVGNILSTSYYVFGNHHIANHPAQEFYLKSPCIFKHRLCIKINISFFYQVGYKLHTFTNTFPQNISTSTYRAAKGMYINPGSRKIQNNLCQSIYLVHSSDRYMMIQSYLPRCWSDVANLCSLLCLCSNPNKSSHAVREISRNKNLDCEQITKKKSTPRAVHYACFIPSTWKWAWLSKISNWI